VDSGAFVSLQREDCTTSFPYLIACVLLPTRCASGLLVCAALLLAGCASTRAADEEDPAPGAKTKEGHADRMGGVSTLDAKEEQEGQPVARLSELLKGRVAGVTVRTGPGGRVIVRVRGTKSLTGDNAPLYVVDGTEVEAAPGGALPSVNPYAVESIRVLKGPSASAYGAKGANGVIIVTTKDGE